MEIEDLRTDGLQSEIKQIHRSVGIRGDIHIENSNGPLSVLFYHRSRNSSVSVFTHSFLERP